MALTAGSKAPDFTVKDQDGKEVKLTDFKGKESCSLLLSERYDTRVYR
jgi:peroxiredoxin